jgi:putative ABC transport system permease protein
VTWPSDLAEVSRTALASVRAHRLRSTLTVLGVAIGVAAVVLLVAMGDGLRNGYRDFVSAQATEIILTPSTPLGNAFARRLKDADAVALADRSLAPDIAGATPVINGSRIVSHGGTAYRGELAGSLPEYRYLAHRVLVGGTFFTEQQARANSRVVVLGSKAVNALFGGDAAAAVGTTVRIERTPFTVIGALQSDGQDDSGLIMPLSTARAYLTGGADVIDKIVVRATGAEQVDAALDQTNAVMSERHGIRDPERRDFSATALETLIEQTSDFYVSLNLDCAMIAALALLVGAVGVANIMLASVTERTREIGIRRAVGARRSTILRQFLTEAAVLGGIGGVIGVAAGVGLTSVAETLVGRIYQTHPDMWTVRPSVSAAAIAFGVSVLVGLVAGTYPALHAARLPPIEALRVE